VDYRLERARSNVTTAAREPDRIFCCSVRAVGTLTSPGRIHRVFGHTCRIRCRHWFCTALLLARTPARLGYTAAVCNAQLPQHAAAPPAQDSSGYRAAAIALRQVMVYHSTLCRSPCAIDASGCYNACITQQHALTCSLIATRACCRGKTSFSPQYACFRCRTSISRGRVTLCTWRGIARIRLWTRLRAYDAFLFSALRTAHTRASCLSRPYLPLNACCPGYYCR